MKLPADTEIAYVLVAQANGDWTQEIAVGTSDDGVQKIVDAKALKALQRGRAIQWPDGTKEWVTREIEFHAGREVFHEDGDRIRVRRFFVSKRGGVIERTELAPVWVDYLKAWA